MLEILDHLWLQLSVEDREILNQEARERSAIYREKLAKAKTEAGL